MSHIERTIADPKGITRRQTIKGAATVVVSLILASGVGAFAVGTYNKAKEYVTKRISMLYANDAKRALRTSHSNPEVTALYEQFLSPGQVLPAKTELSHRLLHTTYGADAAKHAAELAESSVQDAQDETYEQIEELNAAKKEAK
ncbi:MAG: iron hydrogenase small subunit [Slackia piriformis]|uniref:Iron hydrogenase small subunit n=1 Tax=Slackia piriformis TaxID=626934 RepID=A0A943UTP5_9ACTN|nr:iron hydrogenase small subunit [Slackia piriformis]